MALLRPSAVLLLSWALLAGASYYDRRLEVVSTGPLSESAAPSRISCAAWCDRMTGCLGFTLTAGGSCQIFNSLPDADVSSNTTAIPVEFVKRRPCLTGQLLYRDSCYLHERTSVAMNWEECRSDCQNIANDADLFTPRDQTDVAWLLYHPSRLAIAEFIGLKIQNGVFINLDGTTNTIQPDMYNTHADPGYVVVRYRKITIPPTFNAFPGTYKHVNAYICEFPLRCPSGSPCPPGWMSLDNYCYHYVSAEKTWQEADDHCAGLQSGARLSPVTNMGTWRILYQQFGSSDSAVWVGLSDSASEGSFQATDSADWSVTWADGAPGGQDRGLRPNDPAGGR